MFSLFWWVEGEKKCFGIKKRSIFAGLKFNKDVLKWK